jgi:hypothetical protein
MGKNNQSETDSSFPKGGIKTINLDRNPISEKDKNSIVGLNARGRPKKYDYEDM